MKSSYGALFYAIKDGNVGIILGKEKGEWMPFKGGGILSESPEESAIREICEETCGIISLDYITLDHVFSSKRKHYYIGLIQCNFNILKKFKQRRRMEEQKLNPRKEYLEKEEIAFFPLSDILNNKDVHNLTKRSVRFYLKKLLKIQRVENLLKYNNIKLASAKRFY